MQLDPYLLFLFGIRRNCLRSGRSRSLHLPIRAIKTERSKYMGILLLPTMYKILSNIQLSRLTPYAEEITADHQGGFRHNRSTTEHTRFVQKVSGLTTVHEVDKAYGFLTLIVFNIVPIHSYTIRPTFLPLLETFCELLFRDV